LKGPAESFLRATQHLHLTKTPIVTNVLLSVKKEEEEDIDNNNTRLIQRTDVRTKDRRFFA
jgi:hypothetical protein